MGFLQYCYLLRFQLQRHLANKQLIHQYIQRRLFSHKVYHNSYFKYDKNYHVILDNNQKCYIPTSDKVKVYTFLDGTNHVLFDDKWYDVKTVKDFQKELPRTIPYQKVIEEIPSPKTQKQNNSPCRKGLPPTVSHRSICYAIKHGC